jgi:hypothetical protein
MAEERDAVLKKIDTQGRLICFSPDEKDSTSHISETIETKLSTMRKFQLLKNNQTTNDNKPRVSKSTTSMVSPIQTMDTSDYSHVIEEDDSLLAPEILPGLVKSTSSDKYDGWTVPTEVTVIEQEGDDRAKERGIEGENVREVTEAEVRAYLQQIQDTQKLADQRTMNLNRSRLQVAELIKHNSRLLKELKAATGKDDVTLEEHRMMKQELSILKACLFFGALWIWFGGRADAIGIVAFVWMMADVSA